jgi:hypothetical protein
VGRQPADGSLAGHVPIPSPAAARGLGTLPGKDRVTKGERSQVSIHASGPTHPGPEALSPIERDRGEDREAGCLGVLALLVMILGFWVGAGVLGWWLTR